MSKIEKNSQEFTLERQKYQTNIANLEKDLEKERSLHKDKDLSLKSWEDRHKEVLIDYETI